MRAGLEDSRRNIKMKSYAEHVTDLVNSLREIRDLKVVLHELMYNNKYSNLNKHEQFRILTVDLGFSIDEIIPILEEFDETEVKLAMMNFLANLTADQIVKLNEIFS